VLPKQNHPPSVRSTAEVESLAQSTVGIQKSDLNRRSGRKSALRHRRYDARLVPALELRLVFRRSHQGVHTLLDTFSIQEQLPGIGLVLQLSQRGRRDADLDTERFIRIEPS